ncbi:MAG TPA: tetratricopeptide repeat protein [Candidatus Cloacimonetes bacterium]|nr:tetratricopeptide repeat protein [Candidatus Cloacimonadota bacterium]
MIKKIVLILTVILIISLFAEEMSFTDIQTCYYKSYKYETSEKYSKAIDALKDVFTNFPNTYTVNYRLGWLYYLDGKYANALEHLESALLIYPSSLEVLNTINLLYVAREDWEEVEEQSAQILQIDYYNEYANYWYSYSLKMQQKYDLAIKVNRKMLTIFPTSVTYLQELAENLFLNDEKDESKQIFETIIILDPTNTTATTYLEKF